MRVLFLFTAIGCSQSSTGFSDKITDTSPGVVGVLSVEPAQISWTDLEINLSSAKEFVVSNTGDADLEIERIDITNSGGGAFNLDEESNRDIVLASGEAHTAIAVATIAEAGAAQGEFRIRSNDADTPDFRINLCAYTPEQGAEVSNCESVTEEEEQNDSGD